MAKKLLFAAIIIFLSAISASAQRFPGESIKYTLLTSNPDNYQRTALYIYPLEFFYTGGYSHSLGGKTIYSNNGVSIGSSARFETLIRETLMPWVSLRYNWSDAALRDVAPQYPIAVGGLKKQLIGEIGGTIFFSNTTVNTDVHVHLYDLGRTQYFLVVPSQVKRMLGVRGGCYLQRRTLVIRDGEDQSLYNYRAPGDTEEIPLSGATYGSTPAGDFDTPYPVARTVSVFVGIHYRNIKNTKVKVENYGRRSNRSLVDLYADIMFLVHNSISNVVDIDGMEWQLLAGPHAIKNIGWRVGVLKRHSSGLFAFSFAVGQRPGPGLNENLLNGGGFLSVNFALLIASKYNIGHPVHEEPGPIEEMIKF